MENENPNTKKNSFAEKIQNARDILAQRFHNMFNAINTFFKSIKERLNSATHYKQKGEQESTSGQQHEGNSAEQTEIKKDEKPKTKDKSVARLFAASLLDIMASLIFIAAIVIAIKPGILSGKLNAPAANYHVIFEKIGNTLMKIETTSVSRPSAAQAFFVGLCLVIYGLLKAAVLLFVKNGTRKTVSVLTLIMTYFACFMMSDKFLLFAIFILLLYACFEYSCEFPTALIFSKLAFVIITAIIIYISVHLALDSDLAKKVSDVLEKLSLPIKRWW